MIREYGDHSTFADLFPDITVVRFDDQVAGTNIGGDEYPGVFIRSRNIAVIDASRRLPVQAVYDRNINSFPNAISASYSIGDDTNILFDDLDDNFVFEFTNPVYGAGLWIGHLGTPLSNGRQPTTVRTFDTSGNLVGSEDLTEQSLMVIGGGTSNRTFYGIASNRPLGSVEISNPPSDGDGITIDDVQFSTSSVPLDSHCGTLCEEQTGFSPFVGTWSGPIDVPSSAEDLSVLMIIRARSDGTLEGSAEYPELPCVVTMDNVRQDGQEILFQQRLVTLQSAACVAGFNSVSAGTITLSKLSDDSLEWSFTRAGATDVTLTTTLARE